MSWVSGTTLRKKDIMIGTAPGSPGHHEITSSAPPAVASAGRPATPSKEQLDRLGAELILPAAAFERRAAGDARGRLNGVEGEPVPHQSDPARGVLTKEQLDRLGAELILPAPARR